MCTEEEVEKLTDTLKATQSEAGHRLEINAKY